MRKEATAQPHALSVSRMPFLRPRRTSTHISAHWQLSFIIARELSFIRPAIQQFFLLFLLAFLPLPPLPLALPPSPHPFLFSFPVQES